MAIQTLNLASPPRATAAQQEQALQATVQLPSGPAPAAATSSNISVPPPTLVPEAEVFLNAYQSDLSLYERQVDDYNAQVDAYNNSFWADGTRIGARGNVTGTPVRNISGEGFVFFDIPDFGYVGRKPTETAKAELVSTTEARGMVQTSTFKDPATGTTWTSKRADKAGVMVDESTIGMPDGTIYRFTQIPGEFTAQAPSFDADRYSALLQSDFEREIAGQKAQFDLARATENEKYKEQLAEFEKQQAQLEQENERARAAAEAATKAAQEQAAQATAELERRRVQFRQETEGLQRTAGAQRSAYVRARRIRSRPLLGL